MTGVLNNKQYDFDVIAIDCFASNETTRVVSQPARVTIKILSQCKPIILGKKSKVVWPLRKRNCSMSR